MLSPKKLLPGKLSLYEKLSWEMKRGSGEKFVEKTFYSSESYASMKGE